ncbi:hypothetical protein J2R76_003878 [Bradyrhizobium sp. USDA 4532]|uniref:hypothetical protein n=1 Tax=unclassified Bradyrhizobium TaxID=2631580 RepID=UPI00209C79E8|nr:MULTISPECIES: hypothetical protein [unclassified Bradyrhizobium]MCP1835540.1 hypothetical protein [Bradyrhizobium sp. USDA 4545]MCP1920287.1 hypothetical protein [Bradyrhizobium sp. USDA 4532]
MAGAGSAGRSATVARCARICWTRWYGKIARLLEDRHLIKDELERRLKAARNADPTQRREETLRRDLARSRKSIERLLTAYQDSLLSPEELRSRMPKLRSREQACLLELQAIEDQSKEQEVSLRLAESVTSFRDRLRSSVGALDIIERRRVLRLFVKEVLVGDDKIVIAITPPWGAPRSRAVIAPYLPCIGAISQRSI